MNDDNSIDLSNVAYTYSSITSPSYTVGTNGTSAIDWATISVTNNLTGDTLKVAGNADITGSLKVGGKDIAESLERIEERLAILRPNEELEEKWENLRGLRKAYMELEKEILEKQKVWNILQK